VLVEQVGVVMRDGNRPQWIESDQSCWGTMRVKCYLFKACRTRAYYLEPEKSKVFTSAVMIWGRRVTEVKRKRCDKCDTSTLDKLRDFAVLSIWAF
jgi:hypothetical protein